ncbi:hypothetical protein V8G54_007962 [Vigna mungo]|uniref:Kinetochore protein SPC25 n=1 Tax=Vigna mungo TaxID=3915 RepID=A0AAQ3P2V4_VIGMU
MASICDTDIPLQLKNIDAFFASYRNSLQSITATAIKTARSQSQLTEVKAKLREVEDELVKALAVKTRREAKRMSLKDSIASVKERVEVMKTKIQRQRSKCEECASVVSQHRLGSNHKSNESNELKDEAQEAITWYNRNVGFHVEGGHGVKFTFKNIDENNPNEEFCFTIRHEDDIQIIICSCDCWKPVLTIASIQGMGGRVVLALCSKPVLNELVLVKLVNYFQFHRFLQVEIGDVAE